MKPEFYLWLTGTGLTTCCGAGIWMYLSARKESSGANSPTLPPIKPGVERKHLAEISELWTEKTLTLAQVAVIWLDDPKEKAAKIPAPSFSKEDLSLFWREVVEPRKSLTAARKAAIAALLKKLDLEGDCPSVVRNQKHRDEENGYDDDTFALLSTIPLWKHTIEVARAMAKRVSTETLVGDAVICALGHDLGKIPDYHKRGYATGDHPQISAIVVNGIAEYKALSNAQELETIIRSHHMLEPANPLAKLLKICDRIVRQQEITGKMHTAVEAARQNEQVVPQQETPAPAARQPAPPTTPSQADLPQPEKPANEQTDHPLGHKEPGRDAKHVPTRIDLPWFFPDVVLTELKQWINVVAQSKWGAVSMPDGLVYVNQDCLWGILKETVRPEDKATLLAADGDAGDKRDILHSVVWQLSEQRHAIAADLIDQNYYMIPVAIISGSNKPIAGTPFLIPFRSEAFGMLPSDLEELKSPNLRRMVKSIRPKRLEAQGGGQ